MARSGAAVRMAGGPGCARVLFESFNQVLFRLYRLFHLFQLYQTMCHGIWYSRTGGQTMRLSTVILGGWCRVWAMTQ